MFDPLAPPPQGSANPAIYWAPELGCRLVQWQTAYSALLEGDHALCRAQLTREGAGSIPEEATYTPSSPLLYHLLHPYLGAQYWVG